MTRRRFPWDPGFPAELPPALQKGCPTQASVVIIGSSASESFAIATALAQIELARRPVTIVDAWGDFLPIDIWCDSDDPHGVADMVMFGISPARLTRRTVSDGQLKLVGSGTDFAGQAHILTSQRWEHLIAHGTSDAQLIIIVTSVAFTGIEVLASRATGVVLCGDTPLAAAGHARLLAPVVKRAAVAAPPSAAVAVGATPPAATTTGSNARAVVVPTDSGPRTVILPADLGARDLVVPPGSGPVWNVVARWPVLVLFLIAIVGTVTFFAAPLLRTLTSAPAPVDSPHGVNTALPIGAVDESLMTVANPHDSSKALRYSIEIAVLNTRAGAEIRLAELGDIPGSTISPVLSDVGDTWYRVFAGAVESRAAADTLQLLLRSTNLLLADGDRVTAVPYSMRLALHVPGDEAAAEAALRYYISLGLSAYMLVQDDGSLAIYAGAFETAEQANHLRDICITSGVSPRLAYRTGRP